MASRYIRKSLAELKDMEQKIHETVEFSATLVAVSDVFDGYIKVYFFN